jgi:outer membrane protein
MRSIRYTIFLTLVLWNFCAPAQSNEILPVSKAIEQALENNHLLKVKHFQLEEYKAKIKEASIKFTPTINVNAAYQYNVETGELIIPVGTFGSLPLGPSTTIALPNEEKSFQISEHNNINLGATLYQPISQLGKIRAGVKIAQLDYDITNAEYQKATFEIMNAVEQYYYGILIARKRMDETKKNMLVVEQRLYDLESAILAGKTITVNEAGLRASLASEKQEYLKWSFQEADYSAAFYKITGIAVKDFTLIDESIEINQTPIEEYQQAALENNADVRMAQLRIQKSDWGINAAKLSYLPDIGVFVGYAYQEGNTIFPKSNPYAGASFKWNIQDLFITRQTVVQREALKKQAEEHALYNEQSVNTAVETAHRKIKQAQELIGVAEQALAYRTQELNVEKDRLETGLGTKVKVIEIEALLAKAEADLYAAKLSYKMALAEMRQLISK